MANRNAIGADANPLARLIAETKTSRQDINKLEKLLALIIKKAKNNKEDFLIPEVVNCDYWYSSKAQRELSSILNEISLVEEKYRNFFLVSFSNCVKKVSYADPRISVPVKLNPERYSIGSTVRKSIEEKLDSLKSIDVYEKFRIISQENLNRFRLFQADHKSEFSGKIISDDARRLTTSVGSKRRIPKNSVQMIITSPPYASAQKYIRSSSLSLGWTNLSTIDGLSKLNNKNIGRENYKKSEIQIFETGIFDADNLISKIYIKNPLRATIVCNYLKEMIESLDEMIRVIKSGGYIILIVGNNKVCGFEFNTEQYITSYLINRGLLLQFKLIDDIKSFGLMTKRNKTADIISREWVLAFKKQ